MAKGGDLHTRGKELEPARKEAYNIYLATPDVKGTKLRELLSDRGHEVALGTCNSWLGRFKSNKKKVAEKERPVAVEMKVPLRLTVADIAEALLKRVVEALTNYDSLVREVTELREWRTRALDAEKSLGNERRERERILKLHNDQVKSGKMTSTKDLIELAKL